MRTLLACKIKSQQGVCVLSETCHFLIWIAATFTSIAAYRSCKINLNIEACVWTLLLAKWLTMIYRGLHLVNELSSYMYYETNWNYIPCKSNFIIWCGLNLLQRQTKMVFFMIYSELFFQDFISKFLHKLFS